VPVFLEHTVVISAGAVDIGVEYRRLDEATILATYGPAARLLELELTQDIERLAGNSYQRLRRA